MFLLIIFGIVALGICLCAFYSGAKTIFSLVSLVAKLFVGIAISGTIITLPPLSKIMSTGWQIFCIFVGGFVVSLLIAVLAGKLRLVGYSVNYATDSLIVLAVAALLREKVSIGFVSYAIALLLVPRVLWISDRFMEGSIYSHSEITFWGEIVNYYTTFAIDWWGSSENAWNYIPVQVVIASIFYAIGSFTIFVLCPLESKLLAVLYMIVAVGVNVVFDLFVFQQIDESIDG